MSKPARIDRSQPPGLTESFWFPLSTPAARADLVVGGTALLLLLPIGWVLNMGHRLDVVYRIFHDEPPCKKYWEGHEIVRAPAAHMHSYLKRHDLLAGWDVML